MSQYQVIIPVKQFSIGKSRMTDAMRAEFARAFAFDTISAAARCGLVGRVVVVTEEPELDAGAFEVSVDNPLGLAAAEAKKVFVLRGAPEGLNPAIEYAAGILRHTHPGDRAAVLLGDLPALRPSDLGAALFEGVHYDRGFVRDADGTGTTLLLAVSPSSLVPAFGGESARRHEELGYVELSGHFGNLTRDVDTVAALAGFASSDLSPHTRALIETKPRPGLRRATAR